MRRVGKVSDGSYKVPNNKLSRQKEPSGSGRTHFFRFEDAQRLAFPQLPPPREEVEKTHGFKRGQKCINASMWLWVRLET